MKKLISVLLALVMCLSLCAVAWADDAGTGGTPASENFYQDATDEYVWHIKNLEGLKEFRANLRNPQWTPVGNYWEEGANEALKTEAYYGYTIVLDDDIDMSGEANWEPIGGENAPWQFNGTFDGQGHTIRNMTINSNSNSNNVGFFGFLRSGREQGLCIKNLKFDGASVTGNENVAVLAGAANLFSEINGITITRSTVNGVKNVGGVVGYSLNGKEINNITIENTKLYASNKRVGGIAGYVCNSDDRVDTGCGGAYEKCSVKDVTIAKSATDNSWPAESGYLFGLLNSDGGTTVYTLTNCRINGKLVPAATVVQEGAGTRAPYTALNVTVFCYGADNTTNVNIVCTETDPNPDPVIPEPDPTPVEPEQPAHTNRRYPATTTTTETPAKGNDVTSAKTFDGGVALYVGMALTSTLGMAWMGKKRAQ